jgi:peptidoglycan hydrolase CwlO-like protein
MDSRNDEIFSSLRQRIRSVISLYEDQKSKTNELRKRNLELTEQLEALENKLEDIDKKYENLKIAKVLLSVPGEDIHETKLQVNRIVREIDKCIALLNR